VPQRLAEVLFTSTTATLTPPVGEATGHAEGRPQQQQQPHRGVLYMQTAAAEALRNFVVNSVEDAVVDALAATSFPANNPAQQQQQEGQQQQGFAFRDGLVTLLLATWETVQRTRQDAPPVPPAAEAKVGTDGDDDDDGVAGKDVEADASGNNMQSTAFMAAARALEEVLQLVSVCVEGSEHIAEAFSAPPVVQTLLLMLEATTRVVWEALQHPSQLYLPAAGDDSGNAMWLRHYKRREAELLAAVAVAAGGVLHVLSGDNDALATLLQSAEVVAAHQEFLNSALDAAAIMTWLREESSSSSVPPAAVIAAAAGEEDAALLAVARQNILYELCEVSLHVQGALVNSAPNPVNAARVLPLVVAVLDAHPPRGEWRRTVPLLLQECQLQEELRAALINRALQRLRCDQAAVSVLHAVVDAVCSHNSPDLDDEAAFQQNPQAKLLYSSNAMFVVGKLMKDALQLSTNNDGSSGNNNEEDVMVERALRAAAGTTGTGGLITKLQLLVLSNEVGVWSLANTLLLMVPWSGLGEAPSHIWRAIVDALSTRAQLLADAAAAEAG
ncbi:hypothetical protein DQ04_19361000, partial [Trypanosoma grayi]|uniref:hypothetical protein n=1 Tax=Trypanosoma grayi TaxID=71804 RepID=UPI0004F44122